MYYFPTVRHYWALESVTSSAQYLLANPFYVSQDFMSYIFYSLFLIKLNRECYKINLSNNLK